VEENNIKEILYRLDMIEDVQRLILQKLNNGKTPITIHRRDTMANWETVNPIPRIDEVCEITDMPYYYKKGNGITHFNDLPTRGKPNE